MDLFNLHSTRSYQEALTQEKRTLEQCLNIHDLPEIYHYWSNRHIRPKLLPFGFGSPNEMFATYLEKRCREQNGRSSRFVSLGAGNCDLEMELAQKLRALGHENFVIECLELNPAMLARGRAAAQQADLAGHLEFTECDLNSGIPAGACDAFIANQSLHHVVNLEGLFEQVKRSLSAAGTFIISDMIGRNGHRRWPEALSIVHEYWRRLPPSYRFNLPLNRYEEIMEDRDCSTVGFEGIRAQDILPLLLREFHFRFFLAYGNVIDPFVDRAYGHHFDANAEWDRAFIDEVHRRDEAAISSGALTPTHILAVVSNDSSQPCVFPGNLSPEFCVRWPDDPRRASASADRREADASRPAYEWGTWPHPAQRELEIACRHLAEAEARVKALEADVEKRTAWARGLEKEFEERTAWALSLKSEVEERTAWALRLEGELRGKIS